MTGSFRLSMALAKFRPSCRETKVLKNILSALTNASIGIRIPDVTAPNIAGSSSGAVVPPQPGVLNRLDVHLGVGYEFDSEGHLCRRDVINRLYRVDEYGENYQSFHYLPSSP